MARGVAGTFDDGTMTGVVLETLASRPAKFWARHEVIAHVGTSRRFVGWALWRCSRAGWVETADDARSERYQRYRITHCGLQKIGREREYGG